MVRTNPMPVETAADLPTFCSDCGRRLIFEDRTVGFDPATGAPRLTAYAYCRGGWLTRLFGDSEGHDAWIVAPRPKSATIHQQDTDRAAR